MAVFATPLTLAGRGGYNAPLTNAGRGGYNGPQIAHNSDDDHSLTPLNFGRGGYNRGGSNVPLYPRDGDDDEEEDGRGGYN